MKRVLALCLVLVTVMALSGCSRKTQIKQEIFNLVKANYDQIVAACETGDPETLKGIDGIKDVYILDGYINVYCQGAGIVPSSQYYGFYYSQENKPVAMFDNYIICETDALTPEGSGFQYVEDYNVFYTEHIKGSLYFYSASF